MTEASAAPFATSPEKAYHDFLAAGQFRIQKCGACARHVFYPRHLCVHCQSTDLRWVEPKGTGVVYATTTVHAAGGENYNVALIDLDEGVRLMSRVEGVAPQDVRIGLRVRARVAQGDGANILVFDVAERAS